MKKSSDFKNAFPGIFNFAVGIHGRSDDQNQPFQKHGSHQPELFDDHLTIESAHLVDEINQRFPRDLPIIVEAASGLCSSNAWKLNRHFCLSANFGNQTDLIKP